MTQKEFIEVLKAKRYSYEMEGDRIVVTHKKNVDLSAITSLPSGVIFKNKGYAWFSSLISLPSGVVFSNSGDVYLIDLTGGWSAEWKGNIEGIDEKRLLNKMIKDGVFEKGR